MASAGSQLTIGSHAGAYHGTTRRRVPGVKRQWTGVGLRRRVAVWAMYGTCLALCIRLGAAASVAVAFLCVALATGTLAYQAGDQRLNLRRSVLLLAGSVVLLGAGALQARTSDATVAVVKPNTARYASMLATAYCTTGFTAAQTWTRWGTIAATLPFGTRLTVPGYGAGTVLDRGGAVGPGHLDLYMPNCDQARAWGRRIVKVRLS